MRERIGGKVDTGSRWERVNEESRQERVSESLDASTRLAYINGKKLSPVVGVERETTIFRV